jgi:uncharacterized protein (DUF488 family)
MQGSEKLSIWTIGTSNRSIEELLGVLDVYQIDVIIDVRRFPTSKHNHFKREHLEASLNQHGIAYHHVAELGGYRKGGYREFMKTAEFEQGLRSVEGLASSHRVALLCAELLFFRCHRRFIADALKERGHTVLHIIDEKRSYEHKVKEEKHERMTLDAFFEKDT